MLRVLLQFLYLRQISSWMVWAVLSGSSLGLDVRQVFSQQTAPVQAMSSQFLQQSSLGNGIKGFDKVQIDSFIAIPSSTKWVT